MPKRFTLTALTFALTTTALLGQDSLRVAEEAAAERSAEVDKLFAPFDRDDRPGAAVLVVHEGKVVHRRGYGMADLEHKIKIAPDTVFDIASISKQFCGLAIAMLAEQGKLSLDDDVRTHLPWVPDFSDRKITIAHLVHHTSGIRDWPGTLRLAGWRFDDVISFEQILTMARTQRELNFDPGKEHLYSNTGYNLLARTIEKVSGVSFATWTKGHLFDPLGMRDTHFHDDHTRVVERRATAYRQVKGEWKRITNSLTAVGSSSLFTTVDDLAKWIAMFETEKVAGKAAVRRMHTRGKLNDGREIPYCFGVVRGEHKGLPTVAHSGSWAGFRTNLLRFPEQRLAIVVLANNARVRPRIKSGAIASIFLSDQLKSAAGGGVGKFSGAAVETSKPTAEQLAELQGRYHSAELDTSYVIRRKGKTANLEMIHFRNERVTLRASSTGDVFRGDRWWASRVKFDRDGKGKVVALLVSSGRCRNQRFDRLATAK